MWIPKGAALIRGWRLLEEMRCSCISEMNFPKSKRIKISAKCSRFVSSINFENRLISYISKHCFLKILTGKKHHQIKLHYLEKVRIQAFGSLVHQINLLQEVLKLKQNFQKIRAVNPFQSSVTFLYDVFRGYRNVTLD